MSAHNQKPTLYHSPNTRSATILWMLEEIGAPYDVAIVDINSGAQLQPPYLAINPMGKVPALAHRGEIVTEVPAICAYLADAFPQANLAPALDDPRRARYLRWLVFSTAAFEPAVITKAMKWEGGSRAMLGYGDFDTTMTTAAAAIGNGPWLLGDTFSAADVALGSQIRWASLFKLIPEKPEFQAYVARLSARPAMLRSLAKDAEFAKAIAPAGAATPS